MLAQLPFIGRILGAHTGGASACRVPIRSHDGAGIPGRTDVCRQLLVADQDEGFEISVPPLIRLTIGEAVVQRSTGYSEPSII